MQVIQQFIALAVSALVSVAAQAVTPDTATPSGGPLAVDAPALTADARLVRDWALDSGDTQRQPFAVVDKKAARLYAFDADGRLLGATRVLLGQGLGDHSVPGVADIDDLNRIPLADRTTPAGRFASQPGRNLSGEAIVWFDYQAALAIHRVRPGASQAQRMARLGTPGADDKRASLGCVVVPPAFYDTVIAPSLGRQRGVVYVLPERQPVQAFFGPGATVAGGR
ncbi:L,D-transpeptidase [Piscinibacter gummiphilus]|uniref:L,D-transpeptidase n=1 Tax=Piscinibacter gummiphilus TaxID=946333 RepID=A0ABZ0CYK9_9BURK|nr:L,D-transpeptidase [Piscinibacter gummiphilus]WOB07963.1 L,D-transpeptidase [Piscinibacter gummiphilus]